MEANITSLVLYQSYSRVGRLVTVSTTTKCGFITYFQFMYMTTMQKQSL